MGSVTFRFVAPWFLAAGEVSGTRVEVGFGLKRAHRVADRASFGPCRRSTLPPTSLPSRSRFSVELGVAGRFRVAADMGEFARRLAESGLRSRRPELDGPQLRRELLRSLHGVEVPTP